MYIGAHVRTKGSYLNAAKSALAEGANAFQYFPMNPRSLALKAVSPKETEACAAYAREHGLVSIGHAPYGLNPAVDEQEREAMAALLLNALDIASGCGSNGLVVHFGKYHGKDPLQGYKNIIQCLNSVTRDYSGSSLILLENQAGEGAQLGLTMEEMVMVRRNCQHPEMIGFCLDTCHAFASRLWAGTDWAELEAKGAQLEYWPHLGAIHLNDSVHPLGSRRDRHAKIGQGQIGLSYFKELLASPYVRDIPIVLETEPDPDGTHQAEIRLVHQLAERRIGP
ncbi:deoxyribonuclease IV [Paenibacillus oryzisoli]|uniref:deoxyribonuclease IV n=1 Tax=Paenibacillus oryzisoli TaxID=1850517 RepID=UPI003D2C14FC